MPVRERVKPPEGQSPPHLPEACQAGLNHALDWGPGYVWSGAGWGEDARLEEMGEPSFERSQLRLFQQLTEQTYQFTLCLEAVLELGEGRGQLCSEGFANKIPQYRAELRLVVEADPMVDSPEASIEALQTVAALAVGIVHDAVEKTELAQLRFIATLLQHGEEVGLLIIGDEELHHTDAVGSAAHDRRGYEIEPEPLRDEVGRSLTPVEAPLRKIPQWSFTPFGLVDAEQLEILVLNTRQQRIVATVRHGAFNRDHPSGQRFQNTGNSDCFWSIIHTTY